MSWKMSDPIEIRKSHPRISNIFSFSAPMTRKISTRQERDAHRLKLIWFSIIMDLRNILTNEHIFFIFS